MSDLICSIAAIRHQLVVARELAKGHVAFVVIPATTPEAFQMLSLQQAAKLEELALEAEQQETTSTSSGATHE